ncbi:uncharacterized protein V1510DRAFT_437844 [Dipodascopsis tothii]|uniref:uncharacterized protein n=1 Tax=Dipodascopsis tothii TaxID=44089 RepID=UPI0034D00168
MYCLRYFLLVLIMPTTGASPEFLAVFLLSLFVLYRPCVYCSLLLVALLSTTCFLADRCALGNYCFIDLNYGRVFEPRLGLPAELAAQSDVVYEVLAGRAVFGMAWLRSLFGGPTVPATAGAFATSDLANTTATAVHERLGGLLAGRTWHLPWLSVKVIV